MDEGKESVQSTHGRRRGAVLGPGTRRSVPQLLVSTEPHLMESIRTCASWASGRQFKAWCLVDGVAGEHVTGPWARVQPTKTHLGIKQ